MPEKPEYRVLSDYECGLHGVSWAAMSAYCGCMLAGVFLLGMATDQCLGIVYGRPNNLSDSWIMVGAYVSFACVFFIFIFAGLGILDVREMMPTRAGTR